MEKVLEQADYMSYTFRWKEIKGEWQTLEVIGHKFYEDTNRMVLYKKDEGIFEIPSWNQHYSDLGKDWAETVKNRIKDDNKEKEKSAST